MSRNLNVASALLFIVGIVGVLYGLQDLFLLSPLDEELLGVTTSEIRDFSPNLLDFIELQSRFVGLYLICTGLLLCVISLISYRKGEKWAWYATLVIGGIGLFGQLVIIYIGVTLGIMLSYFVPLGIILVILWIVGLALPAKEILGKPS